MTYSGEWVWNSHVPIHTRFFLYTGMKRALIQTHECLCIHMWWITRTYKYSTWVLLHPHWWITLMRINSWMLLHSHVVNHIYSYKHVNTCTPTCGESHIIHTCTWMLIHLHAVNHIFIYRFEKCCIHTYMVTHIHRCENLYIKRGKILYIHKQEGVTHTDVGNQCSCRNAYSTHMQTDTYADRYICRQSSSVSMILKNCRWKF